MFENIKRLKEPRFKNNNINYSSIKYIVKYEDYDFLFIDPKINEEYVIYKMNDNFIEKIELDKYKYEIIVYWSFLKGNKSPYYKKSTYINPEMFVFTSGKNMYKIL